MSLYGNSFLELRRLGRQCDSTTCAKVAN